MMNNDYLKDGERLDDLQRGGYFIIQHPGRFCFGIDAVLLSSFARVAPGEDVLDLGTGTGVIPLLLAGKSEGRSFTGLEIQEESADMARRSVAYNGLEDRIQIVTGDIKEAARIFKPASFPVVTSNPPYITASRGLLSQGRAKALARHEILCDLSDVVGAAAKLLTPGGRFYMVHRPFRLVDIFCEMRSRGIEPKRLRMVQPFADKKPNLALIEGVRGAGAELTVEKPLFVYETPGVYTEELKAWYYD